jgi:tetratricopeptide (TPR) repeat protein
MAACLPRLALCAAFAAVLSMPAMAQHGEHVHGAAASTSEGMDADHGLGTLSFPTSTQVPQAQQAFERGMRWLHLFEYDQARDAFVEAEKLDKDFALAYWGESLTNINGIWHMDDAAAGRAALAKLGPTPEARAAKAPTPREKAFLDTAEQLFGPGTIEERQTHFLDSATKLANDYPDDDEAQLIRALALFGADPKGRNAANYAEAARLARKVLAHNTQHGGAAHYLIHATDDPTNAKEGLAAARALSGIGPMSSHAQHMTSHIFFSLGLWDDAIAANREAIRIDEGERAKRKLPPGRCGHYTEWLQYAYYQAGRLQEARQVFADCVQDNGAIISKAMMLPDVKPDDLAMRQAELLDSLIGMHTTALIESQDATREAAIRIDTGNIGRFGGADLFARGYVAAMANDLPTARTLLAQLQAVAAQPAAKDEYDPHLGERLSIQADMLTALIDAGEGRMDPAIARVREAAKRSDAIPFQFGPPRDVKPPHELAGELLMRQGKPAEALAEFDASLQSAPNRAMSLLGRARALKAMGDTARADAAMDVLHKQWHAADANVVSQSAAR